MTDAERRKAWTIRVPKWADFQHYKDRNPPWLKLHRDLLDKPEWRRLSPAAGKLLIDVWMLAGQSKEGEVTLRLDDLAYRLRVSVPRLGRSLLELHASDLLAPSESMLAECKRVATPETEAEREPEKRTTNTALRARTGT